MTTNLPTTIPPSSTAPIPRQVSTSQSFDIAIAIDIAIDIAVSANAVPGAYSLAIRGQASPYIRDGTMVLTVK